MIGQVAVTCLLLVRSVLAVDPGLDWAWEEYKTTYDKTYTGDTDAFRRAVWERGLGYIRQHNREADAGQHSYRLAMNQYGDWTHKEFVNTMSGNRRPRRLTKKKVCGEYQPPGNDMTSQLPSRVDWRKEGYVTDVKNQGPCGACWAFAATGALEGQHFKKYGQLVSLSESNLIDCSYKEGNEGCRAGAGEADYAFVYVIKNKGINTEEAYPFNFIPSDKCHYNASAGVGARATGCLDVRAGSEADLQAAVAGIGPVAASVDANHLSFQYYRSGVYDEPHCTTTHLDHSLLVVGYGTDSDSGDDYWLIKNSWGTSWGLKGYMMISRNKDYQCGIATDASFPVIWGTSWGLKGYMLMSRNKDNQCGIATDASFPVM